MGGHRGTPHNWVIAAGNILQAGTEDDVIPVERGVGGSGYVQRGPNNGKVFGETATQDLHPETDVAVFFGSINDQAQPLDKIRAAADKTWTQAKKDAPNAKFIVVGPAWMRPEVPENILAIRDTLKELAAKHKFQFVDPITEDWFMHRPDLIGSDTVHPTNAGHRLMAEKITPHLRAALAKK
jgi:lysophospholipase L1-like esterase